jgi:hypothetical protein
MGAVQLGLWIVSILGSLCSIASLVATLFGVQGLATALWLSVAVTVIALFVLVLTRASFIQAPLFSCESSEDLMLHDAHGKKATWRSRRSIMTFAGTLTGFRTMVDATGPQPTVKAWLGEEELWVRPSLPRGTQTDIGIEFPRALRRFRRYRLVMEREYVDTYTGNDERFSLAIWHPAVVVTVSVHFPETRKPRTVRVEIDYAGVIRDAGERTVLVDTTGGTVASWKGWFVRPGQVIRFKWSW